MTNEQWSWWMATLRGLSAVFGYASLPFTLVELQKPTAAGVLLAFARVGAGLFALLGVPPRLGSMALITKSVPKAEWGVRIAAMLGAAVYLVMGLGAGALAGALAMGGYFLVWALGGLAYAVWGWFPLRPSPRAK